MILFVISSCAPRKTNELTGKKLDSLQSHFQFLESELNLKWSQMIEDDDEKLFSMKRLLDEVSYTGAYNEKQYNQLVEEVESLSAMRYDQNSMSSGDLIDQYDSMSLRIISEVIEYAQHHPEYNNYPLMEELVNEIMEAQYNVLNYRIHYDHAADDYNYFIANNQEIIAQITDHQVSEKAVFRIEE
jgi:hypothetical protein